MVEAGEMQEQLDWLRERDLKPMQMTEAAEAFDSKDYLFELMRNGIRCIAYLDENETEIRSARNMRLLPLFPELSTLHLAVMTPCVLDGFIVYTEHAWDYIMRRMYTTIPHEIEKAAAAKPCKMVAHDILYCDGMELHHHNLIQRRTILQDNINEDERLSVSHAIEELGAAFYMLATENGWDGILAKRKDGLYRPGKSPDDWLHIPVKRRVACDFL